jgi:hypothetical protein
MAVTLAARIEHADELTDAVWERLVALFDQHHFEGSIPWRREMLEHGRIVLNISPRNGVDVDAVGRAFAAIVAGCAADATVNGRKVA